MTSKTLNKQLLKESKDKPSHGIKSFFSSTKKALSNNNDTFSKISEAHQLESLNELCFESPPEKNTKELVEESIVAQGNLTESNLPVKCDSTSEVGVIRKIYPLFSIPSLKLRKTEPNTGIGIDENLEKINEDRPDFHISTKIELPIEEIVGGIKKRCRKSKGNEHTIILPKLCEKSLTSLMTKLVEVPISETLSVQETLNDVSSGEEKKINIVLQIEQKQAILDDTSERMTYRFCH